MRVTFLGSGTSTGVPVVGCPCRICASTNPKNKRLRQSVKLEVDGQVVIIDTTPDLRAQLLRDPADRIDFILFTHSHSDHIMGLDDIRPFNFFSGKSITAYANPMTAKAIRRAFGYIWEDGQMGGGKPQLDLQEIEGPFHHGGLAVTPIPVSHGTWTILGYRIGNFAYITDTNAIPETSLPLLENLEVLALDGLRLGPRHPTHFTIDEAIKAAQVIAPRTTYLIHLAHDIDHDEVERTLPPSFHLAYDGLTFEVS